jgi:hypothetical protein
MCRRWGPCLLLWPRPFRSAGLSSRDAHPCLAVCLFIVADRTRHAGIAYEREGDPPALHRTPTGVRVTEWTLALRTHAPGRPRAGGNGARLTGHAVPHVSAVLSAGCSPWVCLPAYPRRLSATSPAAASGRSRVTGQGTGRVISHVTGHVARRSSHTVAYACPMPSYQHRAAAEGGAGQGHAMPGLPLPRGRVAHQRGRRTSGLGD